MISVSEEAEKGLYVSPQDALRLGLQARWAKVSLPCIQQGGLFMGKRVLTYTALCLLLTAAFSACWPSQEGRAIVAVAKIWKTGTTDATHTGSFTLLAGPLENGTAVLCEDDAAFWVKDGVVYVVNDRAKNVALELEQAPPSITYDAVKHVVHW